MPAISCCARWAAKASRRSRAHGFCSSGLAAWALRRRCIWRRPASATPAHRRSGCHRSFQPATRGAVRNRGRRRRQSRGGGPSRFTALNPNVAIEPVREQLDETNVAGLVAGCDPGVGRDRQFRDAADCQRRMRRRRRFAGQRGDRPLDGSGWCVRRSALLPLPGARDPAQRGDLRRRRRCPGPWPASSVR